MERHLIPCQICRFVLSCLFFRTNMFAMYFKGFKVTIEFFIKKTVVQQDFVSSESGSTVLTDVLEYYKIHKHQTLFSSNMPILKNCKNNDDLKNLTEKTDSTMQL